MNNFYQLLEQEKDKLNQILQENNIEDLNNLSSLNNLNNMELLSIFNKLQKLSYNNQLYRSWRNINSDVYELMMDKAEILNFK